MKTINKTETQLKQDEIAARAYQLWEKAGRHHGHDLEYWLQAEAELGAALPSGESEQMPSGLTKISLGVADLTGGI